MAEQQRLRDLHDSSYRWILLSVASSVSLGVANFILGVKIAGTGIYGVGFTGPVCLVGLIIFRLQEAVRNKMAKGSFIDSSTSNWFKRHDRKVKFQRRNLVALAGNFVPNLMILICLTLGFKYAALGGLNQGILPTLTSLASIFTVIVFYFRFYELISFIQLVGIAIMIVSVVYLGLEGASKSSDQAPPAPQGPQVFDPSLQEMDRQLG
mmetsp:Transcript_17523/g.29546  ORF Transcript_17523/g.29546 Transcript_17523/m.29546 type:complete len:209 (+) Transcript_17523:304-930(+)